MRLLITVLCLVALVIAAPQRSETFRGNVKYSDVIIVRFVNDYPIDGPYSYAYELSDGSRRNEEAVWRNQGRDDAYLVKTGRYSYVSPEGTRYTYRYIADENGYQPVQEEGPGDVPTDIFRTLMGG